MTGSQRNEQYKVKVEWFTFLESINKGLERKTMETERIFC